MRCVRGRGTRAASYVIVHTLGLTRLKQMARDGATVDEYIEAAGLKPRVVGE